MGNVKNFKRQQINKIAGLYLAEQEEGDYYDAYLKLIEARENGNGDNPAANFVDVWEPIISIGVDEMIDLIEPDENDAMYDAPEFINNMDWSMLKEQKKTLLELISWNKIPLMNDNLNGIVHLIDAIQDYACDELGMSVDDVFEIPEE